MLVKTFFFTVPLTIAGTYFGVTGIFVGLSISNILGGIYASYVMRKQLKKVNSSLLARSPINDYKEDFGKLSKAFLRLLSK